MRALVVDDEVAVQKIVVRFLVQQGFACDTACDGNEAEERLSTAHYDAVITDLNMPNKHGHALAVHLLALEQRPVIVVHTGVMEPRLAKDLLARGVEDIIFKPVDFGILAAKVKALVERKRAAATEANGRSQPTIAGIDGLYNGPIAVGPVPRLELQSKLSEMTRILPVSKAAFDVYEMTSTGESETLEVAAAVQQDTTLAADVLRLANSVYYNPSAQPISQLERAVARIGQKRIGELALATSSLAALTAGVLPWLNVGLTWKRSMAAGLAVQMLIDYTNHHEVESGLLLSAIMHPLGRVVQGTLYPRHYEIMTEECRRNSEILLEREQQVFAVSHTEVMADLLAAWNVPPAVYDPLKHLLASDGSLRHLSAPARLRVELVRLAAFIGDAAVGHWEKWDRIDLTPTALFRRLAIHSVAEIVKRIKCEVERLDALRTDRTEAEIQPAAPSPARELAYCDLSGDAYDFLGEVAASTGVKLVRCPTESLNYLDENVLVNCIGVAPHRLAAKATSAGRRKMSIVTDREQVERYRDYGSVIALPAAYGRLRSTIRESARAAGQR